MFDSAIVTDFQSSSEEDEGDGGSVRGRKREGIVRWVARVDAIVLMSLDSGGPG